ncbi:OsmC family peroxiredoxin [Chryseobacterium sp. MHB01]|uniref:OsmC family peroxiredoxin n=1 Tax=Chryseobacterium sp. MHB01 TaxID=3109433 RepID=UPI002B000329|nr:OsmC family peroxiredoxin [Chryseobacterium sp. MHB01]MEA1848204.1 OsmC family peroxiredoxin [Chryseobacterium sp. MHB01]
MKAKITAKWQGNFKNGNGNFDASRSTIGRSVFKHNKAEGETTATNPEELMAAAHAACYTMTLNYILTSNGIEAEKIETSCTITATSFDITNSDLVLDAEIPGLTNEDFLKYAEQSKAMCPVGKAYNLEISLTATLN